MTDRAIIAAPVAPLFADADGKELADEALHGMAVTILERGERLSRVQTDYGYKGYAPTEALCDAPPALEAYKNPRVITAPVADALETPTVRGHAAATLFMGSAVSQRGVQDGYAAVVLANGQPAYIREQSVAQYPPPSNNRAQILQTARRFLDAPYRWGGKTRLGIDCSGLAWIAYYMNGYAIYRDASMPDGYPVRPIPIDRADPADLLFFPGHVALYLGDGHVIHAAARNNAVKIEPLTALPKPTAAGTALG